ncbi:hypothetical protein F4802DRAFT_425249 [Xylaria palmicola]|nr:hypothetical protein F4802DRAFT_425249 [Xylaria palmicola]
MYALWSRAAQTQPICRCRTTALTRWATTAAPRRKVTVADVFTACYTTIMGAAAIMDARRKDERRQELDSQLERARASLDNLTVRTMRDDEIAPDTPSADQRAEGGPMIYTPMASFVKSRAGRELVRPLLEEVESITDVAHRPLARQPWAQDQIEWADVETAVANAEQNLKRSQLYLKEPRTVSDMERMTTTVVKLVGELLRMAGEHKSQRPQDTTEEQEQVEQRILMDLDALMERGDFPSYQAPHVRPAHSARVRVRLNESMRRIFNQAVTTWETVGRICHNLLVSELPPSIHTYNTLIAGFNRIDRPDLAQAVIESYLSGTSWPATSQTVICMLKHYRGPGGELGFRETVQRMRGRWGGLYLDVIYDQYFDAGLSWVEKRNLERAARMAKAKRSSDTFDYLIRGWLYHEEIGNACTIFISALQNHVPLPAATFNELLRACMATCSSNAARKLVIGIIKNFDYFKKYLSRTLRKTTRALGHQILHHLIQLRTICWLPFGEVYGVTWARYRFSTNHMKAMFSRIDLELEILESAEVTSLLSSVIMNPSEVPLASLEEAISSLEKAKLERQNLAVLDESYARAAMILSNTRRFIDLEERTLVLIAAVNSVLISIKTGWDPDPKDVILSDREGSLAFKQQRRAWRIALTQIDACGGPFTIEDVANWLFRRVPNPDLIRQLEETGYGKKLGMPILMALFHPKAVSPPPASCEDSSSNSYRQVEEQFQAISDSIRALLFTHVTDITLRRALYHYSNYYLIPLERLFFYTHVEFKWRAYLVLREAYDYEDSVVKYDTAPRRLQPGWEVLSSPDDVTVIDEPDMTSDFKNFTRRLEPEGDKNNRLELSPIAHEGSARLSSAALG